MIGTPPTPMTKKGDVDTKVLKQCVEFTIESGYQVLGIGMHLGESLNLTNEERKLVAKVAVDAANGKVPVIVHTSCPGTREVIDLSKYCDDIGADGVVVIVPYHWRPDNEGIRSHFTGVARAIDIGVVGYNLPDRVGLYFPLDLVTELAKNLDNFIGLKEASFNMEYFANACRETSGMDFTVFAGVEHLIPSMALGGTGSMSAATGIAPKMVMELYRLCKAGEFAKARPVQYKVEKLVGMINSLRYVAGIKGGMAIMGRPVGPPRSPITPLSAQETKLFRGVLDELGVTENEKKGW